MSKQYPSVFSPVICLDKSSAVPMHRQLYQTFRDGILRRQLRPGMKLPSTRDLAAQLEVSRNTVMKAFEQLLAEGFLTGRIGSGTFVTNQIGFEARDQAPTKPVIETPPGRSTSRVAELLLKDENESLMGMPGLFRPNLPALDLFPWKSWSNLVSSCAKRMTREQAAYSGPLGLQSFRETIASYLRTARNVRCEADQIVVVSGSQQALCLASQVLVNPGDPVWVEDPGYGGARSAFLLNGLRVIGVPVDAEGLNVKRGRKLAGTARMAYVTPSHQCPLGMTMSLQRRLELLDWADANGSWIIEDDYDSEYRYVSRPRSSLQGLSEQQRVIYIGTFSKVLFPSIRVGYMVVPPDLVRKFSAIRAASDVYPPTLLQLALSEFLKQGAFARHVRKMRTVYWERLEEIVECVRQTMLDYGKIEIAESGMHVVLHLTSRVSDVAICREAARRGLLPNPLSSWYYGDHPRQGLILGFGGTDAVQIREGLTILKGLIKRADNS